MGASEPGMARGASLHRLVVEPAEDAIGVEGLQGEGDGRAAAADQAADEIVRETDLDDDARCRHAPEALAQVAEERDNPVLNARQMQHRQMHGRAMRLAAKAIVQDVGERRPAACRPLEALIQRGNGPWAM